MIPLRVRIENFMCYRDAQTITFDGASLWVLCGRNGSGKSTIFDAMTFALYGLSRSLDARLNGEELINHKCDAMSIEFDFEIGDKQYRVKRTVARGKTSTFAALELQEGGKLRHIVGTDKKIGLKDWVVRTIGLDEVAFTASVMLRQGYSDALLAADPTARLNLLKQVTNITVYEELYKRAKKIKEAKESTLKIEQARLSDLLISAHTHLPKLEKLQDLTPEYLAIISAEVEDKQIEVKQNEDDLRQLAAFKVQSERWGKLQTALINFETKLSEIATLLRREPEISRNLVRLQELRQVVPQLEENLKLQQNLASSEKLVQSYQGEVENLQDKLEEADAKQINARQRFEAVQEEERVCQQQLLEFANDKEKLSKDLGELEKLDAAELEIANRKLELAQFSTDLASQLEKAESLLKEAEETRQSYPWLEQFSKHREKWYIAQKQINQLEAELVDLQKRTQAFQDERVALDLLLNNVIERVESEQKSITRYNTTKEALEKSLKNLEGLEGQSKCSQCGQLLTEEHFASERERLNKTLEEVCQNLMLAQEAFDSAAKQQKQLKGQHEILTTRLQETMNARINMDSKLETTHNQLIQANTEVANCYQQLPVNHRERLNAKGIFRLETAPIFPTPMELQNFKQLSDSYSTQKQRCEGLKTQVNNQGKIQATLEPFIRQRDEIALAFPPEKQVVVRKAHEELDQQIKLVKAKRDSLKIDLPKLRQASEQTLEVYKNLQTQKQELDRKLTSEKSRHMVSQETLQNAENKLPDTWIVPLSETTLASLQEELALLKPFEVEQNRLDTAKIEQRVLVERQAEVQDELETIPAEARRPQKELEQLERQVSLLHKQTQEVLHQLRQLLAALNEIAKKYIEINSALTKAVEEKGLYVRLEELLGPKNLQQYLLRQAQFGIVEFANEILDRISSGNLRLELRGQNDEIVLSEKPLDLLVYNFETGEQSITADKLSGSQKFRVAVSLALGIGKYASQGTQAIGSVIIDEGFGSLDQEGRDEMIEELHRLKTHLDKIILVSHQEEFSTRFENVWMTGLIEGATQISRR